MRAKIAERPLNPAEREPMLWLIDNGLSRESPYRSQVDRATVVDACGCGCPTIDLAVDGLRAPVSEGVEVIVDAAGVTPEGVHVGIMVFARQGKLAGLEVYSIAGEETFSLPRPDAVKIE